MKNIGIYWDFKNFKDFVDPDPNGTRFWRPDPNGTLEDLAWGLEGPYLF